LQRLWPTAGDIGTVSVLLAEDAIVSRRKITAVLERLGWSWLRPSTDARRWDSPISYSPT